MNAHKKKPKPLGWSSKQEPVEVSVDNPMFSPDHKVGRTNPLKVTATINLRESAITTMTVQRVIDAAQRRAADWFREQWERAGGSGAAAMDYTKERVDGCGVTEAITDRQLDAGKELACVSRLVGVIAFNILVKVAGQGMAIKDIAKSQREVKTTADYLKDALTVIAEYRGFKSPNHTVDNRRYGT